MGNLCVVVDHRQGDGDEEQDVVDRLDRLLA